MKTAVTIEPTLGVTIWKGPGPAHVDRVVSTSLVFDPGKETIVFGRDQACDIVFGPEHRAVGRKHCQLLLQPSGDYRIETFGERAVEINDAPAHTGTIVPDGARIRLGGKVGPTVLVKIAVVGDAESSLIMPKFSQPPRRMRRVQVLEAPLSVVAAPFLLVAWGIGAAVSGLKRVTAKSSQRQHPEVPNSGSIRNLPSRPAGAQPPEENARSPNLVVVSAFAPSAATRGRSLLVQVFLHGESSDPIVAALAAEGDPTAGRRGKATLATEITNGQRVTISLDAASLAVDEPVQTVVWRGAPVSCQFFAEIPDDAALGPLAFRVAVLVDTAPVGAIRFSLPVGDSRQPVDPVAVGGEAVRYRRAFISYASEDRAAVLRRAQALKAARIGFFQDLLSLDPGERWERRLFDEIDRCDLFLLFWSSGAAKSEWVLKEAAYALARRREFGGRPDITPVVLEGPPVPHCPDILRDIHFNDPLVYVIAAVDAERRAPG